MLKVEYERVPRVCNKMFSLKKLTAVLSSDIKKIYKIRENVDQPTDPIF